jgi:hypothetical protein
MEKEKVIIKGSPRKVKVDEVIEKVIEEKEIEEEVIEEEVIEDPIQKYIDGFNPLEKIAYEIAKTRLKTSFDIEKSIGFKSQSR